MLRSTPRGLSALVLVAVAVPLLSAQASGAEDAAFSAEANGAAVRMTTFFDKAPGTSTPVEGPGPVAQAALDAFGSGAFASYPYPGSTAVVGPSLVAGLVPGFPTSPPAYPFYVASSYPLTPTAEQRMGPVNLSARSTAVSSDAAGSVNEGIGALAAKALSATKEGEVTAEAFGAATSFAAGPLTLGKVSATASVKLGRDGRLVKASSLEISAARLGDAVFGIGPSGFVLPGTTTPMPKEGTEQLLAGLARAGMELHYVGARETADSISSASVEVRQHFDLPNGKNTVTWMIGQASARITTATTEAEHASSGITESSGASSAAAPAPVETNPVAAVPAADTAIGRSNLFVTDAPRSGLATPAFAPEVSGPADAVGIDPVGVDTEGAGPPAEAELAVSHGASPTRSAATLTSSGLYGKAPYGVLGLGAILFLAATLAGRATRRRTA